jgi:hypothetical protein
MVWGSRKLQATVFKLPGLPVVELAAVPPAGGGDAAAGVLTPSM